MKFLGIIPGPLRIHPFPCETIGYAGGEDGDTACIRTSSRASWMMLMWLPMTNVLKLP